MENVIVIRCDKYAAKIDAAHGANCISLEYLPKGAHILREPKSQVPDNPYLYGMPVLYPVNRIEGGKFEFEGRLYEFPINEKNTGCHLHGDVCFSPFEVVSAGENFAVCRCEKQSLAGGCHDFSITLKYSVSNNGLQIQTEIFNASAENMPNFLGFHTTFALPFCADSRAENVKILVEVGEEIERNMQNYLPTGRILNGDGVHDLLNSGEFFPAGYTLSRHYRAEKTGRIKLCDTQKRLSVHYENDGKFGWRLLYNGGAKDFICLEPQTCMANCMNAPFDRNYSGFDYILPQSKKTYTSKIYVKENE